MKSWVNKVCLKIEKLALKNTGVSKKDATHNSFFFENQCLFYLKKEKDKITIGCHKGYLLEELFSFSKSGKYMRHLYIKKEKDFSEEIISSYINEAIISSIELNEKNKLRQELKRKRQDGYITSD